MIAIFWDQLATDRGIETGRRSQRQQRPARVPHIPAEPDDSAREPGDRLCRPRAM